MVKTPSFDVIIVGAGLSGIGSACHLTQRCPDKSYAIFEAREDMGGTWDLFRYPGIRSDSDMHTLGFKFKPWIDKKAIADGPSILNYIKETADEFGVKDNIHFNERVISAAWSSETARWTIVLENTKTKAKTKASANFLMLGAGYYRYDQGHRPDFPGEENFKGPIVHPQKWTDDIDYENKNVVVIGSGATAVTLVPEMAKTAKHVTMLQRTPTYVVSLPGKDRIANILRAILPNKWAYAITRFKNITRQRYIYGMSQKKPEKAKKMLRKQAVKALGKDFDYDTHLKPPYNPWDQRMCLIPDGDFFDALNDGNATIVTDHIKEFTSDGIALKSGKKVDADLIVTATGISLVVLGEITFTVDGQKVHAPDRFGYKGMMFSDVPNMISIFGYVNASWTLRADLLAEYMCRLLNYMDEKGVDYAVPRAPDDLIPGDWLEFQPGYVTRALDQFPKQGHYDPWRNVQDYKYNIKELRHDRIDDPALEFGRASGVVKQAAE